MWDRRRLVLGERRREQSIDVQGVGVLTIISGFSLLNWQWQVRRRPSQRLESGLSISRYGKCCERQSCKTVSLSNLSWERVREERRHTFNPRLPAILLSRRVDLLHPRPPKFVLLQRAKTTFGSTLTPRWPYSRVRTDWEGRDLLETGPVQLDEQRSFEQDGRRRDSRWDFDGVTERACAL